MSDDAHIVTTWWLAAIPKAGFKPLIASLVCKLMVFKLSDQAYLRTAWTPPKARFTSRLAIPNLHAATAAMKMDFSNNGGRSWN